MAGLGGIIHGKSILASAAGLGSVPNLAPKTNRFLAFPGGLVENGVRRVAAAGIVHSVISLRLVALVDAALAVEAVDLPRLAIPVDG